MSLTLRIILIIGSVFALIWCFRSFEQTKLKVNDSVGWIIGCIFLILMSVFSNVIIWISDKIGFIAPVNFVFFVFIIFLLIQVFIDNLRISELNEKLKNIDHYLALKEKENREENEENKKEQ